MIFFSFFRAPKTKAKGVGRPFLNQMGMIVLSTTIANFLILTVLQLFTWRNKKNDRCLTAMMVLSNIEGFALTFDEKADIIAFADSVMPGCWLNRWKVSTQCRINC